MCMYVWVYLIRIVAKSFEEMLGAESLKRRVRKFHYFFNYIRDLEKNISVNCFESIDFIFRNKFAKTFEHGIE